MAENGEGFESALTIEVSAEVTHPPGTTYDSDGSPIPPKDDE
jgi:hypothetical protein